MSSPYPVATPQRSGWGPLRISGLVLTVLSLVVGAFCAVKLVVEVATPAARLLQTESRSTPLDEFLSLEAGGHRVYVRVEGRAGNYRGPNLGHGNVEVIGPAGAVEVRRVTVDEELDLADGGHYVAVAAFDVPTDGQYRVTITGAPNTVVVGPSVVSGLSQAGGWLVGTLVSGLVLLVGLGLLIASFVRRRPAAPAYGGGYPGSGSGGGYPDAGYPGSGQPATTTYPDQPSQPVQQTPAGWYPDPQSPEQLRYWDGAGWTAHVQPRS